MCWSAAVMRRRAARRSSTAAAGSPSASDAPLVALLQRRDRALEVVRGAIPTPLDRLPVVLELRFELLLLRRRRGGWRRCGGGGCRAGRRTRRRGGIVERLRRERALRRGRHGWRR